MSDIIKRAEELLAEVFDREPNRYMGARGVIRELIAELKTDRKEARIIDAVVDDLLARLKRAEAEEAQWGVVVQRHFGVGTPSMLDSALTTTLAELKRLDQENAQLCGRLEEYGWDHKDDQPEVRQR